MTKIGFIAEGYPDTGFGNYSFPLFKQFQSDPRITNIYLEHYRERTQINHPIQAEIWHPFRLGPNRVFNRFCLQMAAGFPITQKMKPFDVVHLSTCWLSFLAPDFKGQKVIITCHDLFTFRQVRQRAWDHTLSAMNNLKRNLNYFSVKCLKKADTVVAISEHTKNDILSLFNIPENKIKVVYNGVDHDRYTPMDKAACRKQFNFGKNQFILLNVGTENHRKNTITLLRALTRLKDPENFLLVRVGRQSSQTREYIARHNLEDRVRYLPFVQDLVPLYNAADAFVFPSIYEGFGLVILEAMASGCPVITTCESAIPEVTGKSALTVQDPFDSQELACAIETLAGSGSLQQDLKIKGINRAKHFSWKACADNLHRIYLS